MALFYVTALDLTFSIGLSLQHIKANSHCKDYLIVFNAILNELKKEIKGDSFYNNAYSK